MPTNGLYASRIHPRRLTQTATSSQQPAQEHHAPPTFVNLSAGIGASHIALRKNGLDCVYANEPDHENLAILRRNAPDMPRSRLDHRDINQVPLERIPNHTLLAAWLPLRQKASHSERRATVRNRILEIVQARNPPFVLLGTVHVVHGLGHHKAKPSSRTGSYRFAVHTAQELDALGYRSTFAYYHHADFDLPLSRQNLFIVGVRADQNAPFKFKPPPGRSPGLGLHRCLLPPEASQNGDGRFKMKVQLVDNVWTLQRNSGTGKIKSLAWTIPHALPPNHDKTPYIPVGHWICRDRAEPLSYPICHQLGFATGLGPKHLSKYWYLVTGLDGRAMIRQLLLREVARLQGLPDKFLLHKDKDKAERQICDSAPPPMLDWIVGAMKQQFPHILSTHDKRTPEAVAGPHARNYAGG